MRHWHKEPLLHFLIIGAVIFVVFSMANKEEAAMRGMPPFAVQAKLIFV